MKTYSDKESIDEHDLFKRNSFSSTFFEKENFLFSLWSIVSLFSGNKLEIVVIEAPPFIILNNATSMYANMVENYKNIDMTEFNGFFKDVILYLQTKMGFIPVIRLAHPTIEYNQLVDGVYKNLFDTIMATITISAERSKIIDFSIAILPRAIRVITRKPKPFQFDFLFFLKPFSWELWLLLLATIPYISILLWFFERNCRTLPGHVNNEYLSFRKSIYYAICCLFGKGHPYVVRTNAGRLIMFAVHILQIILLIVYTARVLQFLITQSSDPVVSGIDDIKNGKIPPHRVGIVVGSRVEDFYLNSVSQGKKDYYPLKSVNEIYSRLMSEDIDVGLWNNISAEYHVNNIYCDLTTVGVEFWRSLYQLPLRHGWLYKTELDFSILSFIESGELDRVSAKWFGERRCGKTNFNIADSRTVTIRKMSGLFLAVVMASIIAILIHFGSKLCPLIYNIICSIWLEILYTCSRKNTLAN